MLSISVKVGQLAIAIHSGSRTVGKYIGGMWRDRAKASWLKGYPFPCSNLFSLSTTANPDLVAEYLEAEATAANYAFVNRLILAELLRLRLRQVYGDIAAPLVCDIPHNLTFPNNPKSSKGWIVRKGACAAGAGQLSSGGDASSCGNSGSGCENAASFDVQSVTRLWMSGFIEPI